MSETAATTPTPGTAAEVYEADLEGPEHEGLFAKAGRFVVGLASAAFGDDNTAFSGVGVVVRRKDDHSIAWRLDAGNYESDQTLLDMVRDDLGTLSPEDFLEQWGQGEAAKPE